MITPEERETILSNIELLPNMMLDWGYDGFNNFWIEIVALRPDRTTHELDVGYGGRRIISPYASESDIVRAAYGALASYNEHEAREGFTYCGYRVFSPHISIKAHTMASQFEEVASIGERPDKEKHRQILMGEV